MDTTKRTVEELVNKKKMLGNTAIQSVGTAVNLVTGICITGALARYLGTQGFGELSLALTYFSFAGMLVNLGYATILVRELAKLNPWEDHSINTLLTSAIILQFCSTILALGGMAWYLAYTAYDPMLKIRIFIMCCAHLATLFNSFESVFKAKLTLKYTVYAAIIYRIFHLALIGLAISLKGSLTTIVLTYIASNLCYAILLVVFSKKLVRFRFLPDLNNLLFVLKETLPLGVSSGLWIIYYRFNVLILDKIKGVEAVAIYNAAFRFVDYAYMISSILMVSIYPLMAPRFPANIPGLNRIYQKTLDYFAIIGGSLSVGLMVAAPFLIRIIFGVQFEKAGMVLQIFGLVPFLVLLNNCCGTMLLVLGMQGKPLFYTRMLGIVLNLSLNLALIPRYSYFGAALATILTDSVLLGITPFIIRSKLGSLPMLRNVGIGLLLLPACFVLAFFAPNWYLKICLPVSLWSIAVVFLFRYNKDELKAMVFGKMDDQNA